MVLVMASVALPVWAQKFSFDYPKQWQVDTLGDKKIPEAAPTAHFTSRVDSIIADVSILEGRDASGLKPDDLREIVMAMVADSLPTSLEAKARPVAFGDKGTGMYVRLTSTDPNALGKYYTVAVHRSGGVMALGQLTSGDDDGAMLAKFLGIVNSVVADTPTAAASASGRMAKLAD
jgi:hypothetical protein